MNINVVTTIHTDMTRLEYDQWIASALLTLKTAPPHVYFCDLNLPEVLHVCLLIFLHRKYPTFIFGHTTINKSIAIEFFLFHLQSVNMVFSDEVKS